MRINLKSNSQLTYKIIQVCIILLIVTLGLYGAFVLLGNQTNARVSGSSWQAGRIIDDALFYDNNSMTVAEIQGFLNQRVSTCDTQGTARAVEQGAPNMTRAQYAASKGWAGPPYVCIKDYYQVPRSDQNINNFSGVIPSGAISAAEIIKRSADTHGVSPKALLVTIEKESLNLLNDSWPVATQYRNVMGYGCPDTAPCDPQYEGFYNQMMNAARQFKLYKTNPGSYRYKPLQNNTISFQANAPSCGATSVFVENYATAGLYNYTPYQPNRAALNNMYGSGDSCSAYGNRNFWRIFNDWFGSTRYTFGITPSNQTAYAKSTCNIRYFADDAVGRLYNPDRRDFIYTRDYNEACRLVSWGYIWDDIVMENATGPEAIPIYRIANSSLHVFTSDPNLRANSIANGYTDQGVAYYAYSTAGQDRVPVYGVQLADTFFTTTSGKEAEYYRDAYGYHYYGVVFYAKGIPGLTQTPLTRLERSNQRLYTPHNYEMQNALRYGYKLEGSVGSVDTTPSAHNMPVYRTRSQDGIYTYTTDRAQRDNAIVNYNHTAEGIPFYALMWSDKPVFGAWNQYNGFRVYAADINEYNQAVQLYNYGPSGISWYSY